MKRVLRTTSILMIFFLFALQGCQSLPTPKEKTEKVEAPAPAEKITRKNKDLAANFNVQLGIGYLQQGDLQRAQSKLLLAKKLNPKSPTVMSAMGYFMEVTGEPKSAEDYYRKAIALKPKHGDPHNNYGTFLCRHQRYKEAVKQFELALLDPEYTSPGEAAENAGLCEMQAGHILESEKFFIKALQKQPNLPNSLLELAQISYDKSDYKLAKKYIDQYDRVHKPTAESLWLQIRLGWQVKDHIMVAKNAATLKDQYGESNEYKDYLEAEKQA